MSKLTDIDFASLTILAKQIAAAQKAKRADAPLGKSKVATQVVLDVSGTVTVGKDYEQEIVLKADPFTMLAVALSHCNGVTMDSIAREARTADPEYVASIKEKAVEAWGVVKADTLKTCQGKVTVAKGASVTVGAMGLKVN